MLQKGYLSFDTYETSQEQVVLTLPVTERRMNAGSKTTFDKV
jgi:hypothetical protein